MKIDINVLYLFTEFSIYSYYTVPYKISYYLKFIATKTFSNLHLEISINLT